MLCLLWYYFCCLYDVFITVYVFFFFFKQKTAYEMRISDWSSDVCSSDLKAASDVYSPVSGTVVAVNSDLTDKPETINEDAYGEGWIFVVEMSEPDQQIGRASCRERVCQYV